MGRTDSWRAAIGRGALVVVLTASLWAADATAIWAQAPPAGALDGPAADEQTPNERTPDEQTRLAEADAINFRAIELFDQGKYAEAAPLFEEALAVRGEILGEQSPEYAVALNNLAEVCRATGDFARAEPLLRQAAEIWKSSLGEQTREYATAQYGLGQIYFYAGDYARAEPLFRRASDIFKAVLGEQDPDYAASINNLAQIYRVTGDYARAEPLFRQAAAIWKATLGPQHPNYATSLDNLGVMFDAMGDFAQAEPLYLEAAEIRKVALGEQHPAYAMSLNNLGSLYQGLGDYAQAESMYRRAAEIQKLALGPLHPDYAKSLNSLAVLYYAMGKLADAEPLYVESLAIRKATLGEQHMDYVEGLNNLATLYSSMGDHARAGAMYRQALTTVSSLVDSMAVGRDETGQLRLIRSVKNRLDIYLSFLLAHDDNARLAYEPVLNWKGATLVRQRAARMAANNAELAPRLAKLQAVVRQWSELAVGPPPTDPQWQQRLAELKAQKERLEAELSARSAAFRGASAPVKIRELQQALPEGAALVDYFEFPLSVPAPGAGNYVERESMIAFVVRPSGEIAMFNLGEIEPIAAAIETWRGSYGASAAAQEAGQLLRAKLWAPLEAALGDATTVLISPDGALGKLPFAALPGKAPGGYLIEDVALALVPVPRMIPTLASGRDVNDRGDDASIVHELLLVGGVDYDRRDAAPGGARIVSSGEANPTEDDLLAAAQNRGAARQAAQGMQWPALPGTAGESAAIGALFRSNGGFTAGSIVTLSGAAATEEQFRAMAPTSRILHVATHGFFAPAAVRSALAADATGEPEPRQGGDSGAENLGDSGFAPGLLSGLVLAGANNPPALPDKPGEVADWPEDGILTAEELAFLPLTGVRLVVLSACETGLGEVAGGEGLLGMQRAFQVAGARTTIATLWKVDDAMTQRLMTSFYRNVLERQEPYLESLRNAQLEILRDERAAEARGGVANQAARGVKAPGDALTGSTGKPYFWAAFTLSGDWQ